MKAYVNQNTCIGCGLCTSIAPNVFALNGNGYATNILGEDIPVELNDAVQEAASSCPVEAISVE